MRLFMDSPHNVVALHLHRTTISPEIHYNTTKNDHHPGILSNFSLEVEGALLLIRWVQFALERVKTFHVLVVISTNAKTPQMKQTVIFSAHDLGNFLLAPCERAPI